MSTTSEKNTATLIHLSSLTQYFIPFGGFIFPILLWSAKKNDSQFVDENGKQVINFQLSMFLYSLVLALIAIPITIYTVLKNITINDVMNNCDVIFDNVRFGNITGFVILIVSAIVIFSFMKIIEFILIIHAAVKASNGENYKYPLTINFFK